MKTLFFLAALAFNVSVNLPNNTNYETIDAISIAVYDVLDFIVMDDDIMLVSTSPSNGNINNIQVFDSFNTLITQNSGCNASECSTDLSSLSVGRYSVSVETTTAHTFTGMIEIK